MDTRNEPIRTVNMSTLAAIAKRFAAAVDRVLTNLTIPSLIDEMDVHFFRSRRRNGAFARHVVPVKAVRASSIDMPVVVSSTGDIQAASRGRIKGSREALMTLKHVILVPTAAIQHDDCGPFICAVLGGKAMLRRIRRGPERDDHSVIFNVMLDEDRGAVRAGDAVIIESDGVVRSGAPVKASVMPAMSPSLAAY